MMASASLVAPTRAQLPTFYDLEKQPIISDLEHLIEKSKIKLDALLDKMNALESSDAIDWNDMRKLDTLQANILEFWRPVEHIHSVQQTDKMNKTHEKGLALVTAWQTQLAQNKQFYQWMQRWFKHTDFSNLNNAQQTVVKNILKQFELSGIHLPEEKQKQYKALNLSLAKNSAQFETNIVNASREHPIWTQHESQLKGLPERLVTMAAEAARQEGKKGWLFRLNGPTLQSIMTNAEDHNLRETFYTAWVSRASGNTQFDNTDLMYQILRERHELSQLTHFNNYAERSLADNKMADSPQAVMDFLTHLVDAIRPQAEKDLQTLQVFAHKQGHAKDLCDWDLAYFSEKLRQEKFGLEEEKLRDYFPLPHVLKSLYQLLQDQFQITLQEVPVSSLWDPAVIVLEIKDNQDKIRGYLYLDLYARENKRSGAWLGEYTQRRLCEDQSLQLPIAFLTCNFAPPAKDEPALITHDDVLTLFHEMGHALHHTLTQINEPAVSGIEGVPWDAVEFPSQLLEQFPWEPLVLKRVSAHYKTGESLPSEVIQSLNASRRFQAGLRLIRQLELALFDFQLHLNFNPHQGSEQIQICLDQVRQKTRVLPVASFNRFQNSFAHIFSGSYAAGYYSYLWAEVLAADAFGHFLEEGIQKGYLNLKTGQEFMETILESGGSIDILQLFKRFRKREPDHQAFLKRWGLASE